MADHSLFFTAECVLGWCLYLLLSKVISSYDIKFKNFIKCYAKNPPCLLTVRITIKAFLHNVNSQLENMFTSSNTQE